MRRRSIDFQISMPSRFQFPTANSDFHLQDSNKNQFQFLPSLTLAPSDGLLVEVTQSAHGAVWDDMAWGLSSVGQRDAWQCSRVVRSAQRARGKSRVGAWATWAIVG
jgi:hypothetical protein